jgi:hypothetical protein
MNQFKEALSYEKKNYAILHAKVGDNDLRAIESNIYLKQFTAKAVQAQIETKKMQRTITSQVTTLIGSLKLRFVSLVVEREIRQVEEQSARR